MFKRFVDWVEVLVGALAVLTVVLLAVVEPAQPSGATPDPDVGASLYASNCAGCHGPEGGGGVGPTLAGDLARFDSIGELATFVSTGVPGRMPGFETRLTPDEINALVDFVWSDLAGR